MKSSISDLTKTGRAPVILRLGLAVGIGTFGSTLFAKLDGDGMNPGGAPCGRGAAGTKPGGTLLEIDGEGWTKPAGAPGGAGDVTTKPGGAPGGTDSPGINPGGASGILGDDERNPEGASIGRGELGTKPGGASGRAGEYIKPFGTLSPIGEVETNPRGAPGGAGDEGTNPEGAPSTSGEWGTKPGGASFKLVTVGTNPGGTSPASTGIIGVKLCGISSGMVGIETGIETTELLRIPVRTLGVGGSGVGIIG